MQEGTTEAAEDQPQSTAAADDSIDFDQVCKQGIQAYAKSDFKAAIQLLEQAFTGDNENWKARACLGLSYYNDGQLDSAKTTFEHIVANCPDEQIKTRSQQAMERVNKSLASPSPSLEPAAESPSEAAAAADVVPPPSVVDDSAIARDERGRLLDESSTNVVQQQIKPEDITEADREKYCKWGTNCYLNAKYDKAVEYLELGLTGDPENWNVRFCLGMSYFKLEQFDTAAIILTHLIDECPDNKLTMRAQQALNNVKMTQAYPDGEADSADMPASIAAIFDKQKEKRHHQQQAMAVQRQKQQEQMAASIAAQRSADTARGTKRRGTHPVAYFGIFVSLVGIVYYSALQQLPGVYSSMFVPKQKARGVDDVGQLYFVSPKQVSIRGPHGRTINAQMYEKAGNGRWVILHPGMDDDLDMRKSLAEALIKDGFSVVLYDSEGNGSSTGDRSWQLLADDGLFVYDYLAGKMRLKGDVIISYGNAFGAATAVVAGTRRPHRAIVVENPFSSLSELARKKNPLLGIFPDSLCPEPRVDVLSMMKQHPPLLVVVSKDKLVPEAESNMVFNKATDPKQLQTEPVSASSPHWDAIIRFLQQ